jgi:NADP-dependent 3-hydroxy acid dehydrogenase YdfG
MRPLSAEDIADVVAWCASRPPHVNLNVVEVMPTEQAFGPFAVHREG